MARYPGAFWHPLPENESEPAITPTQLIFHSAVSRGDSLYSFFNKPGVVVESHLYVRADGDAEQYIDTEKQADANYKANVRAISVETWDDADPDRIPWTPAQMARLADIAAWAHLTHGIPLIRAPRWDAPGMGGHTDYPRIWTPVAKTCPGIARRGQVNVIIEMAKAIVLGGRPLPPVAIPPTPTPPVPAPSRWVPEGDLLRKGVFGPKTSQVQAKLGITVDSYYGDDTANAVRNFQRRSGLLVDGIVGPKTWARLFPAAPGPAITTPPFPLPRGWYFGPKSGPKESVSGYFSYRDDLKRWQNQMIHRGWDLGRDGADGLYGPATEAVAREFQRRKSLDVDGLIGPETWRAAWL